MEPNFKSRVLSDHRSGFTFFLSSMLTATNWSFGLAILIFVKFSYTLHIGIIIGFAPHYLHYICNYAQLLKSNYLGRNEPQMKDMYLSLCPIIGQVTRHLFKFSIASIFLSAFNWLYIVTVIYVVEIGLMKNENIAALWIYSVSHMLLIGQACYREFLWWFILKLSCTKPVVIVPNQEQAEQNDVQNIALEAEDDPRTQLRDLNNFFGTLYAVNVYRNFYPNFNDPEQIAALSRQRDISLSSSSSKSEEYFKVIDHK